ncbi:MAG TPA: hypothetical protein VLA37_09030, partial [Sphingomonadaceae bacterium]|nr:hypothetical protein [Sphingomonadaceae bacterium]
MSKTTQTTRRSFLKTGAIVAVPVAAVVTPAAVMAADDTGLRLARLEAERAIEALNRDFLREFNRAGAGGTARLFADGKAPELGDHTARLLVDPTV